MQLRQTSMILICFMIVYVWGTLLLLLMVSYGKSEKIAVAAYDLSHVLKNHRKTIPDPSRGITTVLTTCCRNNVPNVDIIKKQFEGLTLAPVLLSSVVIGFDGIDVRSDNIDGKCRGSCDEEKYKKYISDVIRLAHSYFQNVDYVIAPERVCLSVNLKNAMQKAATDFVYVCQEDMMLAKPIDIVALIQLMAATPGIDLVRPAHHGVASDRKVSNSTCKTDAPNLLTISLGQFTFTRSDNFSDQNHITYKAFYEEAVWPYIDYGSFMEHQLFCAYETHPHLQSRLWCLGGENDGYYTHMNGRHAM